MRITDGKYTIGCCTRNGEQKVRVSGSRNRNIKIKGGKFCIDDVLFTPKAKKAITID